MRTENILKARFASPTSHHYGDHPRQTLHVWKPNGGQKSGTTVVFFYGGSWQRGGKDQYGLIGQRLRAQGHVCVIPDYRVHPEVLFPTFVEDAASAVAWVFENAESLGTDKSRVFLLGHSAGGHLAAMLCVDPAYLGRHHLAPKNIAGGVGLAASLASPLEGPFMPIFPRPSDQPFRPIEAIRCIDVPLLLIHGRRDKVISAAESIAMTAAYRQAGGTVTLRLHPFYGHATILGTLATTHRFGAGAELKRFLHPPNTSGLQSECPATGLRSESHEETHENVEGLPE